MGSKRIKGEIERSAVRAIQQDGFEIVGLGIFIAVLAVFIFDIRYGGITGLGILAYFLAPPVLRKYITYPRIGYAKFIVNKNGSRIFSSISIVILCLTLFYFLGKFDEYGFLMPLFIGLLFSVFIFWQAYRTGLAVKYILGTVYLAAGNIGICFTLTGFNSGIVTGFMLSILSIITIMAGIVQALWFIKKFPLITAKETNDG